MNIYNIADLNAQAEKPSKISIPGIYSGFKITKAELTEGHLDMEFFAPDINKMHEMRLYTTVDKDWKGNPRSAEDTAKAESKVMSKLLEICRSVGDIKDLETLTGDYKTLLFKLFKYIESRYTKAMVNLKVHQAGDWTKVSSGLGSMEKHVPGNDPKLYFSAWELDNGWNTPGTPKAGISSSPAPTATALPSDMPF